MISIQPASPRDIPSLVSLVNSAYRGDSSRKGWTTEADLLDGQRTDRESLTRVLADPDSLLLTCLMDEGTLVGCVHLQRQGEDLYLGMLTVSPDKQGAGIGKSLLAAAEVHAKASHCRALTMTVISVRHELIAWYQRHGYTWTGETKPFPTDVKFGQPKEPLEFIVLKKSMTGMQAGDQVPG